MISCSVSEVVKCPEINAKVELTKCRECSHFLGYCEDKKFYPRYIGYVDCQNDQAFNRVIKEGKKKNEERKKATKEEMAKFYKIRLECDNCGMLTPVKIPRKMKVGEYLENSSVKKCPRCGCWLGPDWISD